MEIDRDIVPKFVDPVFWLHYFPPIAKHDLIEMGVKVDWRRSLSPPLQNTYMHTHRPALAHRVSRPRGTGSVGDSVGEGERSRTHSLSVRKTWENCLYKSQILRCDVEGSHVVGCACSSANAAAACCAV